MDHALTFTTPPEPVQRARRAMASAEQGIARATDPMTPCPDLSGIALAFLTLEALHPAYPPLGDIEPSPDPAADIAAAVHHLRVAAKSASSAVDTIRYAITARELQDLDLWQAERGHGGGNDGPAQPHPRARPAPGAPRPDRP